MMPMHLVLLTIVKKSLKNEMTYEEVTKQKQIEDLYSDSKQKAFYYMSMM